MTKANLLNKFVETDYKSYEDFIKRCRIKVPPNFNFAFDVVDEIAAADPGKTALVWCDDKGEARNFTFGELKKYSDQTASFLKNLGIKKGDPVMLILKRRYEFWFASLALHKLGAICIPATHLLTTKDIIYRNNAADIKMIIAVNEPNVLEHIEDAQKESPTLKLKAALNLDKKGWLNFNGEIDKAPADFPRPAGDEATTNSDKFLLYFTSGTTGMPKMVLHNYTYPLGHILTAVFWQNLRENSLHLTVADTGWAKAAWGRPLFSFMTMTNSYPRICWK